MRISDWSSDVCSSDLTKMGVPGDLRIRQAIGQLLERVDRGIGLADVLLRACQLVIDARILWIVRMFFKKALVQRDRLTHGFFRIRGCADAFKIGRHACWERVC